MTTLVLPRRAGRLLAAVSAAALALGALAGDPAPAPEGGPPRVLSVTVHDAITGGTAEFLKAAFEKARNERFAAVAISLDTPGGALDATREIVQAMLESPVPVLVWVGPAGARAGSAGVFVTMAADVAAMHPTSNIGAAHPVLGGGQDIEQSAGKDMAKKVENDTAAFARSIAEARGRPQDWAEKAVRESVSVTSTEAVKLKVVDLVADSLDDALAKADGRTIRASGTGKRTLALKGALVVPFEQTIRQRLLSFLADPNVVGILMMIGTLGIAIEFYHPGLIFPGAAGALALFLAFLGSRLIPVNVGAVLLVIVGVGLLVAEAYLTTHGIAGLGGAACVVLGMLFFVDKASPDYHFDPGALQVSPWVVWPTPIAMAAVLLFLGWKVAAIRRQPLALGAPALVGASAEALSDVGPGGGEVFLHGEYWRARSAAPLPKGTRVRVESVDGLVVNVVAADPPNG
ncbi:MAG: nodulation protein NfeD [Anaeromyxobacter sp.]